ncbi:MAG: HD domain-containing protein [Tenacibaculum sp.]|nr:HD domain-containing protein [Tenacibaculum sp.]
MKDLSNHNFYKLILNEREVLLRVLANGSIDENVKSLEVYNNKNWIKDIKVIKSFMNRYMSGWITDEDIVDKKVVEESLVTGFTLRTIEARNLAIKLHNNQKYGNCPYIVHLTNVVNVLLHFGTTLEEDVLLMSGWLHDIIEDTNIDLNFIKNTFGEEVKEIVLLVTNQNYSNKTNEENKIETFKRIITNQNAIIVKLADRIANVEFSLLHSNIDKITKYKKEQVLINMIFESNITTEKGNVLFNYLNKIMP